MYAIYLKFYSHVLKLDIGGQICPNYLLHLTNVLQLMNEFFTKSK